MPVAFLWARLAFDQDGVLAADSARMSLMIAAHSSCARRMSIFFSLELGPPTGLLTLLLSAMPAVAVLVCASASRALFALPLFALGFLLAEEGTLGASKFKLSRCSRLTELLARLFSKCTPSSFSNCCCSFCAAFWRLFRPTLSALRLRDSVATAVPTGVALRAVPIALPSSAGKAQFPSPAALPGPRGVLLTDKGVPASDLRRFLKGVPLARPCSAILSSSPDHLT
mmetsp:Transcript_33343/g.57101  ORF Transcript_33343/g.57101 Transcript_33343/m.57101 type:complete len:227 (-) Transcript_33343:754-1434(-)